MTRRLSTAAAALVVLFGWAVPALAQAGRASGIVRDVTGEPIAGAAVTAVNPDTFPSEVVATTDEDGRWAMIGLTSQAWTFVAQAPGYSSQRAVVQVSVSGGSPLIFNLARAPGVTPGALDRNILLQIARANALRDGGRYEEALDAYGEIRDSNPKLTSLGLVVAGVYRSRAEAESDAAARQELLDQAIAEYTRLLDDEALAPIAAAEIEDVRSAGAPLQ